MTISYPEHGDIDFSADELPSFHPMKRHAFTLMELLAVIVILGILITIGSRGLRVARINARKAQARIEMKSIETAVKAYVNKYGELPLPDAMQGADEPSFDEAFSRQVVEILCGLNADVNPAGTVFLDPQGAGEDGTFTDPWGAQYRIALDTDYDKTIDSIADESVRRNVAIVAEGFYLQNGSKNPDDRIRSWE